jgi:hypothetical protein
VQRTANRFNWKIYLIYQHASFKSGESGKINNAKHKIIATRELTTQKQLGQ